MKKDIARVNALWNSVELTYPNGFSSYVPASSAEHAKVIAYVINHPELADVVIDQKACDDWYEQRHSSNKYDK